MPLTPNATLPRRQLLLSAAGAFTAAATKAAAMPAGITITRLTTGPAAVRMIGGETPATELWTYDRLAPGPIIRLPQGKPFHAAVENRLAQSTTVHWHGIRLPNAMDGIPGLTQKPIPPGGRFDYAFTPPDAGTFWYHSHDNGLEQIGRGLAGALLIEEAVPPTVDRDLVWTLQDWRLDPDAQIVPGFDNRMEAAMDGRVGNTVTINGRLPATLAVRAGERVRLRLLNAAIARILALRFEGHRPVIVALDGQPCDPHEPADGRILLGPAMRVDIMLDMQGEPGRTYQVVDDFYERLSYTLTRLAYDQATPLRPHPLAATRQLPPNPVPRPELGSAVLQEVRLQGGMMSGMGRMMGGGTWAINDRSMTGDGSMSMPPLLRIARGRSCILDFRNETAWWHPMHLHGHSFRVLSRNGAPVPHDAWGDTVLVRPREHVRVAFVADNPGTWLLHCHVMEHQDGGLMTTIDVI
ncbi:multicopper oxidase family protein [Lichenicoccus sp.]|uniref:multicopper oxidase family protein n=1 Tax=Lichenicoccus sp. TaxID=2781899 RepID=UPI003D12B3D0